MLELVQAGAPGATVIPPADGSLDREARRIVQAVRDRYGVELPVLAGDRALSLVSWSIGLIILCLFRVKTGIQFFLTVPQAAGVALGWAALVLSYSDICLFMKGHGIVVGTAYVFLGVCLL